MKKTLCVLLCLASAFSLRAHADSATWALHPTADEDWNTADNWTPQAVPDGPNDVASFGPSDVTSVYVNAHINVDSIVYNADAPSYLMYIFEGSSLSVSGDGFVNNSTPIQSMTVRATRGAPGAILEFQGEASAGSWMTFTTEPGNFGDGGGSIQFSNSSTADHAQIANEGGFERGPNGGTTYFSDSASAGNSGIINIGTFNRAGGSGATIFDGNATADHASIINGASPTLTAGGTTQFFDDSTAGEGTFVNEAGTAAAAGAGSTQLFDTSTAGTATLTSEGGATGGYVLFADSSTAGSALLTAESGDAAGGSIQFTAQSDGGTATVSVSGNGNLDVSGHEAPGTTIGSLEGNGLVTLGANSLTIGSNNLDSTFSGVISGGGGIEKIGDGTLTLTGANTYTGNTYVKQGKLLMRDQTGDLKIILGNVMVQGGTFGGSGLIGGTVTVGTSSRAAKLEANVTHGGNFIINKNLTFNASATYQVDFNSTKGAYSIVWADGVTIRDGAQFSVFDFGDGSFGAAHFVIINNTGTKPISGRFANLPDGGTIVIGKSTCQVNYEGGDGNDLELTTVQ